MPVVSTQGYQAFSQRQVKEISDTPMRNLLEQSPLPNPQAAIALKTLQVPLSGQYFEQVSKRDGLQFPRDNGFHLQYASDWYFVVAQLYDTTNPKNEFYLVWVLKVNPTLGKFLLEGNESPATGTVVGTQFTVFSTVDGQMHAARPGGFLFTDPSSTFSTDPFVAQVADAEQKHVLASNQAGHLLPAILQAQTSGVATPLSVDLVLAPGTSKPLLQGDEGFTGSQLLRQGYWYYSWPMLQVAGTLAVGGVNYQVKGLGWLDHQWGTVGIPRNYFGRALLSLPATVSRLSPMAGWNWFEFQGVQDSDPTKAWIFTGAYLNSFDPKTGQVRTKTPSGSALRDGQGTVWNPLTGKQEFLRGRGKMVFQVTEWVQVANTMWPKQYNINCRLKNGSTLRLQVDLLATNQLAIQPNGVLYMEAGAAAVMSLDGKVVVSNARGFAEAVGFQSQQEQIAAQLAVAGIPPTADNVATVRDGIWRTMQKKGIINAGLIIVILTLFISIMVCIFKKKRK